MKASLSILDFGAVGDAKTDCTAAIQTALLKATEHEATVFVPAGVYLTSRLYLPAKVGLVGEPTWSFREFGGSILRLNDPSASCLLDLTSAKGSTVNGLCLDGQSLGQGIHGIGVDKPGFGESEEAFRIERCRISNFTGDGIHLNRIWCFSIRHNMVSHNEGNGINLHGWDGFILDNWLSGNRKAGFNTFDKNASITFTSNRVEWNRQAGIQVHGGGHYNFTGNYIDRSGGPGIAFLMRGDVPCRNMTATGNVIYRSGAPNWGELGENESVQMIADGAEGLVFGQNAMHAGRNDRASGEFSPDVSMILRRLKNSVITNNVMNDGSLKKLIVDLGEHGENVVIENNVGTLLET